MDNKMLLIEVKKLMNKHQNEIETIEEKYKSTKSSLNQQLKSIETGEIDQSLVDDYLKVATHIEDLMTELVAIQTSFKKNDFAQDAKKTIAKMKPRATLNKKIRTDGWIQQLQEETLSIMQAVENCNTYPELMELLKKFYHVYVDACYIKGSTVQLLKESGVYQEKVSKLTSEINEELDELQKNYKTQKKTENLSVYPEINHLKEEFSAYRFKNGDYRFTNGDVEFGNGYNDSLLLGTRETEPIEKGLINYSKKYLNDDLHGLTVEKLVWNLNPKNGSAIIELPSKIMANRSESLFYEYVEQLLFTFIKSLPVKKVKIAAINCPDPNNRSMSSPFTPMIQRAEKNLDSNIMYAPIALDSEAAAKVIHSLFEEGQKRGDDYFTDGYDNIYQYNQQTLDNQHDFKLLLINNYPFGFSEPEIQSELETILQNSSTGIITVVFQTTNEEVFKQKRDGYSNELAYQKLDYQKYNAIHLTNFDFAKKTFCYNGLPSSFNLESDSFDRAAYWSNLKEGYSNSNIIYINDLLDKAKKSKTVYSINQDKMLIPIGKENAEIYNLPININSDSSAIILGTTGSGKSSLLHCLVLGSAYMYSPDELKICLVDFKGADASTEFTLYKKGRELYLPHINYLSLKSRTENVLDMLDMIENIQNERMKIISKHKAGNLVNYNNLPEIRNNPKKMMPRILFIIDEFNTMLAGGAASSNDSAILDVIESRIYTLLTRVRSTGITIIFSGHSTSGLREKHLNQIKIRIGLSGFTGKLFDIDYSESESKINDILSEKGKSFISTDGGTKKKVVKLAFSGNTGSNNQVALAQEIRDKYAKYGDNYEQVVAGSTDYVNFDEINNLDEIIQRDNQMDSYSFPAYVGLGSTSSLPVAVRFSSEEGEMNYLMTGESSRLAVYERNIILGFAYTLKMRSLISNTPNIHYFRISRGIKDNHNELNDYLDYPVIKKAVSITESEYEACEKILDLFEIYQKRASNKDKDITPYLLVVHNVSWLNERGWLEEETKEEENFSFDFDLENMDTSALIASADSLFTDKKETKEQPRKEIDPNKVKKALATLYAKGYMQNFYVILASSITTDLKYFVDEARREKIPYKYTIADSFNFEGIENKYPSSCCHINSTKLEYEDDGVTKITKMVSSKTRLFDYASSNNQKYLKKMFKEK